MAMHRLQKLVSPKSEADTSRSLQEEFKVVGIQADELEPDSDLEDNAQSEEGPTTNPTTQMKDLKDNLSSQEVNSDQESKDSPQDKDLIENCGRWTD